jgi:hypothetical protein
VGSFTCRNFFSIFLCLLHILSHLAASIAASTNSAAAGMPGHRARPPVGRKSFINLHFKPIQCGSRRVQSRPGHYLKSLGRPRLVFVKVKVNHVSHFLTTTINVPIVPIKRQASSKPPTKACERREFVRATAETKERGVTAVIPVQRFPNNDFAPSDLVHSVVSVYHRLHVFFADVVALALAAERCEARRENKGEKLTI